MRISDWSSDVCSSGLPSGGRPSRIDSALPSRATVSSSAGIRARALATALRCRVRSKPETADRKSVVKGTRVYVRVDLGGRRHIKKKYEVIPRITRKHNKH